MKIGILGNGSLGSITALGLAEAGHKVLLFGKSQRRGSASKAAGAMIAPLGEVENNQLDYGPLKKKFDLSYLSATTYWPKIIRKLYGQGYKKKFDKRGTFVFTNNFSSPYEYKDFNYLKNLQKSFKNEIFLNKKISDACPYELKGLKESIYLKDSYVDTQEYFKRLDDYIDKLDVKKLFDFDRYKIEAKKNKIILKATGLIKKKSIQLDYLIIALGAYSQKLFDENKSIFKNIQKIFFGTGFAFSFFPRNYTEKLELDHNVYRTMNRGNACGFHSVPISDNGVYFGASSTVTDIEEFYPRLSSVNVLSSEVERQFDYKFLGYQSYINYGHRPISADTFPLLGPLEKNPNIIIATGNKREGFTQSPLIASLIQDYISGNKESFYNFNIFKPERKLISFFDRSTAIRLAAEAKLSGESMHVDKPDFNNWEKKVNKRENDYKNVYKKIKLRKNFGIHPEMLSLFLHKKI